MRHELSEVEMLLESVEAVNPAGLQGRPAAEITNLSLLRGIYEDQVMLHYDLFERSNVHREEHGPDCTLYPSSPTNAPLWPLLTILTGARRFLEVGCGLGYTAALMAEAGGPTAQVDTIEADDGHAALAETEMHRRGLDGRVRVLRGRAKDVLADLTGPYDIVFVDTEWEEYPSFPAHLARLTKSGGVLVTANLFPPFEEWREEPSGRDAVQNYLRALNRDGNFRTYVVPRLWKALSYRTG